MKITEEEKEKISKIKISYFYSVVVFFLCTLIILSLADFSIIQEKVGGSVDALEGMTNNYQVEIYLKYMEDPTDTNVFMLLFEREHNGEIW